MRNVSISSFLRPAKSHIFISLCGISSKPGFIPILQDLSLVCLNLLDTLIHTRAGSSRIIWIWGWAILWGEHCSAWCDVIWCVTGDGGILKSQTFIDSMRTQEDSSILDTQPQIICWHLKLDPTIYTQLYIHQVWCWTLLHSPSLNLQAVNRNRSLVDGWRWRGPIELSKEPLRSFTVPNFNF